MFEKLDVNNTNTLTPHEISVLFGMSDKQLREFFARYDTDGNGTLDFSEFNDMINARFVSVFRVCDKNDDGVLTLDEMRTGLEQLGCKLTSHEIDKFFSHLDRDASRTVDLEEVCTCVSVHASVCAHHEAKHLFFSVPVASLLPVASSRCRWPTTTLWRVHTRASNEAALNKGQLCGKGQK